MNLKINAKAAWVTAAPLKGASAKDNQYRNMSYQVLLVALHTEEIGIPLNTLLEAGSPEGLENVQVIVRSCRIWLQIIELQKLENSAQIWAEYTLH